jgi:hypothetical protein
MIAFSPRKAIRVKFMRVYRNSASHRSPYDRIQSQKAIRVKFMSVYRDSASHKSLYDGPRLSCTRNMKTLRCKIRAMG